MIAGGISYSCRTYNVADNKSVTSFGVWPIVVVRCRPGEPGPPAPPIPSAEDATDPESEKRLIALVEVRMPAFFLARPVSFLTKRVEAHSSSNATSSNPASGSCSKMAASRTRSIRLSASRMTKTKISLIRSAKWAW